MSVGSVGWEFWLSLVAGIFIFFVIVTLLIAKLYRKVEQGKAMIVNTMRAEPNVTFTGSVVVPVFHKMEVMDISLKTIEIDRQGKDGLICNDNIRADIKVAFFVRVNKNREDVMKVAQAIGCERASSQDTLEALFSAKFSEALKTVGKSMDFVDLYNKRDDFRDRIVENIGTDLNGYILEDAAIDYLEQTPVENLDPDNILDAEGIRKITNLTAEQNVQTNILKRDEEMKIKKKDVETKEAILALERQEADAVAKQKREVESVKAREEAETKRVQSEEREKAETARIKAEEAIEVQQQNKQREVEVAEKNKERAVAVEQERVKKAQELEVAEREKVVTLTTIENEKQVEREKKEIAEVIRERVEVDKTVAQREEEINELRVVAEADRNKKAQVIAAEAQAEEDLVKEIKEAEAREKAAEHIAKEKATNAQADLDVAEKDAEAKRREAEGIQAVSAAPGLAEAKVMEAKAQASEQEGMAEVRVMEAKADATEKTGLAEAKVLSETMAAEADGMTKKFEAMDSMSDAQRAHEEFRMQLDKKHTENMKAITANVDVAKEQAIVLGQALKEANIDIVGGDTAYFDSFVKSLSVGKSIDGTINKSDTLQVAFKDHLTGEKSFVEDAKGLLASLGSSSSELQNMSVTALVTKLMQDPSPQSQNLLGMLKGMADSKSQ